MSGRDNPEFRKDLVSGEWVLVAVGRRKRPIFKTGAKCPFDDPQKNGNPFPLLWFPHPQTPTSEMEDFNSWFVQVIPNKYPLLSRQKECPAPKREGAQERLWAVGYHEVIITRDHLKTIDKMSQEETQLVLKAYKERYRVLAKDGCIKYILIFHNQGRTAGASVAHPHSQLVALPVIDPDVSRSLKGSFNFYKKNKKCVHCVMIDKATKDKSRIVNKNKHFVTLVPFAPKASYETRIYPLAHASRFEDLDKELFPYLADALRDALSRINKVLNNPDYNFFIHTAPVGDNTKHYHWHIEILPRDFEWAGFELGGGIEIISISPEEAALSLREAKIKP
ncbi:HIT domain-containing protein [Patescibacteria group bacterium]|nr:HIT domain-containing protein [Patescibacteria group bacterium]